MKYKIKTSALIFLLAVFSFASAFAGCGPSSGSAQSDRESVSASDTSQMQGSLSSDPQNSSSETAKTPDGLVVKNGKLTKGGEEFYGAGINYFSMFTGCFSNKWDITQPLAALEVLKSYDCKVIRFSTLPFYAKDMGYYFQAEEMYWNRLDELVDKCERLDIGLLPSLFWTFSCFDYYNEIYEEAIFDDDSRGMTFIREYTEKFVSRYAESPAIYGWEFSNEKILSADIPGQAGTDSYYSTAALNRVYTVFADTVAANDPYGRMISTGDTNPRETQYNQWKFGNWTRDTAEQHAEVMRTINPGKIDVVSQHQYSLGTTLTPGDKTSPLFDADTWKTFFAYLIDISSSMGKACYVGEVGYGVQKELGWENVTLDAMTECYRATADAAYETKMQLILYWNYDHNSRLDDGLIYGRGSGTEFSYNENMAWGKLVLETMKSLNARFAADKN